MDELIKLCTDRYGRLEVNRQKLTAGIRDNQPLNRVSVYNADNRVMYRSYYETFGDKEAASLAQALQRVRW